MEEVLTWTGIITEEAMRSGWILHVFHSVPSGISDDLGMVSERKESMMSSNFLA